MQKLVKLGGMLGGILLLSGCAIDSPAEWQIAVESVLINAFREGSVTIAMEHLENLRIQEVIDEQEYAFYKERLLQKKKGNQ